MSQILYTLGLVFLASCSDYKIHALGDDVSEPGDIIVDSAEPQPGPEPEPEPDTSPPEPDPVYPDIEVSHTLIDFGNLNALGDVGIEVITVKNVGDADLRIADLSLSTGSGVYTLTPLGSTVLVPAQQSNFSVSYDPVTYETNTDSVTITSNDPDEPTVTIPIEGNGSAPVIEIDPYYHDFGLTLIGCDGEKEVVISNIGNVDLVITSLDFYVTYPAELEITLHEEINGPLPWIIPPTSSKNVMVGHEPYDELTDSGFIEVRSNDPITPMARADQIADGDFALNLIDEFEQDEVTSADILFVIDNSGSMGVWQTALTDNFSAFIGVFAVTGVDYQIAVITTDDATFQGPILSDTTPDLEAEFTSQAIAGTYGSSMEKGLHYAELATMSGGDAAPGSTFLREDAKFIIIFVSDEKDWSSKIDLEYATHFKSLKATDSMAVTHAVVGDSPTGCSSSTTSWARADYGEGYIEVSDLMGGEFVSLCAEDWGAELEGLAHDSILNRSFELTDIPYEETIVVEVDGSEVSDWTYNDIENSVDFMGTYVPESGTEIEISYSVLADCDLFDTE
jgi:hypothetical protein